MKTARRVIGIDDVSFDKFMDKKTQVIGVIYRGGAFMDGVLSTHVQVDGSDSTQKIIGMINRCKFLPQLQCILLDGIAVGGFNVVDVQEINKKTGLPVIVVMRNYPDFEKIVKTLKKLDMKEKIALIEKAGPVIKHDKIHIQVVGINLETAKQIITICSTHSYVPEPIRVAHLIGQGLAYGESKGRA